MAGTVLTSVLNSIMRLPCDFIVGAIVFSRSVEIEVLAIVPNSVMVLDRELEVLDTLLNRVLVLAVEEDGRVAGTVPTFVLNRVIRLACDFIVGAIVFSRSVEIEVLAIVPNSVMVLDRELEVLDTAPGRVVLAVEEDVRVSDTLLKSILNRVMRLACDFIVGAMVFSKSPVVGEDVSAIVSGVV